MLHQQQMTHSRYYLLTFAGVQDGIEWVTGTKLTGSNIVPTGEISFKAKIGRRGRLGTPDMYPPEMGVIARYRGSGCIAQSNLAQPT